MADLPSFTSKGGVRVIWEPSMATDPPRHGALHLVDGPVGRELGPIREPQDDDVRCPSLDVLLRRNPSAKRDFMEEYMGVNFEDEMYG